MFPESFALISESLWILLDLVDFGQGLKNRSICMQNSEKHTSRVLKFAVRYFEILFPYVYTTLKALQSNAICFSYPLFTLKLFKINQILEVQSHAN